MSHVTSYGPYTCSMMFSMENVVTLFSISGVVTFSSPDPKCSHVFKGYARFHQELGYLLSKVADQHGNIGTMIWFEYRL